MQVIELPVSRWKEFRELRLQALKNEPLAFADILSEAKIRPPKYWKSFLTASSKEQKIYFIEDNKKLVGMLRVGFDIDKYKHMAEFTMMYVDAAHRGKGVGSLLMQKAMDLIKQRKIVKVKLTVSEAQESARRLYEKYGFKVVGTFEKNVFYKGKYYADYRMEIFFD